MKADRSERGGPLQGNYIMLIQTMDGKLSLLVTALLVLDIIDGDFKNVSVLDTIKLILYTVCIAMIILKERCDR